jgi:hypothetical protein
MAVIISGVCIGKLPSSALLLQFFPADSILVQFGAHRDLQENHIGGRIVYFYNV